VPLQIRQQRCKKS